MPAVYFDEDTVEGVRTANQEHWNGYALLFDIKDSTARKRTQSSRWVEQTLAFYKAIGKLANSIKALKQKPKLAKYFQSLETQDDSPIIKFIGDSGFIFVPCSYASTQEKDEKAPVELSRKLLQDFISFRNESHNTEALGGMRLKTVFTYLTNTRPVRNEEGRPIDILGRGVDFTFRLETYAGDTHIVINEMLKKSLFSSKNSGERYPSITVDKETYYLIHCKKDIKGWDEKEQEFYLLGLNSDKTETFPPSPSAARKDVETELLSFSLYLLQEERKKLTQEALDDLAEKQD